MGIPFTLPMGFLFTVTMGILLTISISPMIWLNRHGFYPCIGNGQPSGNKCARRNNAFIAWPNIHSSQNEVKCIEPTVHSQAIAAFAEGSEFSFKSIKFVSHKVYEVDPMPAPSAEHDEGHRLP